MPANTTTLRMELILDDRGSVKVRRFGRELEQTAQKGERSFTRMNASARTLMRTFSGLVSVYAAQRLAGAFIRAASDLQEVSNKFDVVFRGQTEQAERWANTLVRSYAMSTREAKQYLAAVQDLLVPMGMQAEAAGRLSNEIVKLSADLGSFNNLPTARVMDDIQSALVGNYETMKKYGVVLNATLVQERALAMGLAASKDELTAAHKAFAAYRLIVEGSTAAIGDMARTHDDYANQMKQLKAALEDLSAAIGALLIKPLTAVIRATNDALRGLQMLFGAGPDVERLRIEAQLRETEAELAGRASALASPLYVPTEREELLKRKAELEARLRAIKAEKVESEGRLEFKAAPTTRPAPGAPAPAVAARGGGVDLGTQRALAYQEWYDEQLAAREALAEMRRQELEDEARAREQALKRLKDWGEENKEVARDTARGMSFHFENLFFGVLTNRFESLGDLAGGILRSLEQQAARLLSQMAGRALSGVLGGAGGFLAGIFHGGGVVGATPVPLRVVDPAVFRGAPRLHGGLRPDEFPAILEKGERVTPRDKARRGGGGVNVVFNIQTPDAGSFKASQSQLMTSVAMALRRARRNM